MHCLCTTVLNDSPLLKMLYYLSIRVWFVEGGADRNRIVGFIYNHILVHLTSMLSDAYQLDTEQ